MAPDPGRGAGAPGAGRAPPSSASSAEAAFAVPAAHPAFPGHFPGHPLLPGVLLLDAVAQAARRSFGLGPAAALRRAKFAAPVRPGETVRIALSRAAPDRVAFACTVGERPVAHGEFAFHP